MHIEAQPTSFILKDRLAHVNLTIIPPAYVIFKAFDQTI